MKKIIFFIFYSIALFSYSNVMANEEAEKSAENAKIEYVSNKCIKQEYQRLFQKSNPVFPVLKN